MKKLILLCLTVVVFPTAALAGSIAMAPTEQPAAAIKAVQANNFRLAFDDVSLNSADI